MILLGNGIAIAQEDESPDAAARRLLDEGVVLMRREEYQQALEKLELSIQLARMYENVCNSARCRVILDRVRINTLEALHECWSLASGAKHSAGAEGQFDAAAKAEETEVWAYDEMASVEHQIPRVVIQSMPQHIDMAVWMDGVRFPTALVGVPRPIDPGEHEVRAEAPGYVTQVQTFTAAEGKTAEVLVELARQPAAAAPPFPGSGSEQPGAGPHHEVESATASAGSIWPRPAPGTHLEAGVGLSGTFGRQGGGGFNLGSEISLARVGRPGTSLGLYLDGLYSFGGREGRFSVGPQAAAGPVGLDIGYLLAIGRQGSPQHGATARPRLSLGPLTGYVRAGLLLGERQDWFGEVGVLMRLPVYSSSADGKR